jgi:hypothetical protein
MTVWSGRYRCLRGTYCLHLPGRSFVHEDKNCKHMSLSICLHISPLITEEHVQCQSFAIVSQSDDVPQVAPFLVLLFLRLITLSLLFCLQLHSCSTGLVSCC